MRSAVVNVARLGGTEELLLAAAPFHAFARKRGSLKYFAAGLLRKADRVASEVDCAEPVVVILPSARHQTKVITSAGYTYAVSLDII